MVLNVFVPVDSGSIRTPFLELFFILFIIFLALHYNTILHKSVEDDVRIGACLR